MNELITTLYIGNAIIATAAYMPQCWKLWQGAEITWDGKVLPCCFDKDAQYEMGNLTTHSFKEIWLSESYRDFRANLLQSRQSIDICQNCSEGTKVWG